MGKTVGNLDASKLTWLYQTYQDGKDRHPEGHNRLEAIYFASDLAALILRYRTIEGSKQKQPYSPTLHPALMNAISKAGIAQERFASPLDHSPLIPAYSSKFEQDQLFGAQYNAYSRPWDGTSVVHPPHDDKEMEKAVRWAIASATQAEMPEHTSTTCTIFTLPENKHSAYTKLLTHPLVTIIDTIPASHHKYAGKDAWMGDKHHTNKAKQTPLIIFAVANTAGYQHLLDNNADFMKAWITARKTAHDNQSTPTPPKQTATPTAIQCPEQPEPQNACNPS